MHFLWRWLLYLLVAGSKRSTPHQRAALDDEAGRRKKGMRREVVTAVRKAQIIPLSSTVSSQSFHLLPGKLKLLHHTLTSCSLSLSKTRPSLSRCLGRVVPLGQKMTNIPQIFIFQLQRGDGRGGGGERETRWWRGGGGEVRPLPLPLSAQTKEAAATIIQSQKRDEKQMQRGRGAQRNSEYKDLFFFNMFRYF